MFPGVEGFSWSAGNLIFLGIFYTVALTIAATFAFAVVRALLDFKRHKAEAIRWKADFEDLPAGARACRHELTNEIRRRICNNAFECGKCATHALFLKAREAAASLWVPDQSEAAMVFGFEMPLDRMYHRGHTWVQPKRDGTLLVGLDDFGSRLMGKPDEVELPQAGTHLQTNGTACRVHKDGSAIRVLSPVDGEVIETHMSDCGWLIQLKPSEGCDTRHLLQGAEVRPWILREIERLQLALSAEGVGLSLADGGEVVRDVPAACPKANWPGIWSEMFLEL